MQQYAVNKYLHNVSSSWIFINNCITMQGTMSLKFKQYRLYKMLHVSSPNGHHQARINKEAVS